MAKQTKSELEQELSLVRAELETLKTLQRDQLSCHRSLQETHEKATRKFEQEIEELKSKLKKEGDSHFQTEGKLTFANDEIEKLKEEAARFNIRIGIANDEKIKNDGRIAGLEKALESLKDVMGQLFDSLVDKLGQ